MYLQKVEGSLRVDEAHAQAVAADQRPTDNALPRQQHWLPLQFHLQVIEGKEKAYAQKLYDKPHSDKRHEITLSRANIKILLKHEHSIGINDSKDYARTNAKKVQCTWRHGMKSRKWLSSASSPRSGFRDSPWSPTTDAASAGNSSGNHRT